MDEMNLILIKAQSLEALHDNIGEAIEALYEMQDEVAEQMARDAWFAKYLRGPF